MARPETAARARPRLERLLLGDRARWLVAPTLVVALLFLAQGFGKVVTRANPSLDAFRKSPREFVGSSFTARFARVTDVGEHGFRLRRRKAGIDVTFEDAGVSAGAIVSVRGVIGPDLRLAGQELRIHRGRRLKWLLGAVILLLSAFLAVRELRGDADA